MFGQSVNMLSNCGYQYGTNIADLFTGIPYTNTIFTSGSCSGLGSTGICCNSNPKTIWGMILGTGAAIAASIGINWGVSKIQEKQVQKAAAARQEKMDTESLNNAMKTLGLSNKTTSEVISMSIEELDAIKIKPEYNSSAKSEAGKKVSDLIREISDAKRNFETAKTNKSKAEQDIKQLQSDLAKITDVNSQEYKDLAQKIKDKKDKVANSLTEAVKNAEENINNKNADLKKAEKELKEIEEAQIKFNEAKQTVKEAIEREQNRKTLENKKNNKPSMGV